jgi:hypothetical protein
MPANVTDHDKWKRAEKKAAEQGQGENYAYVSGVYQAMGGTFTSKTEKSGECFHVLVTDNQPMLGSVDDSGLYGTGVQYDLDTMTEANGGLSKATGIVSGQIPRMTIPSALTAMPRGGRTAAKLLSFNEPVHSPAGVTRGLALSLAQEQQIQTQVRDNIGHPEVNFRTSLNHQLQYMQLDPVQRKAVTVRASRYYRDHGDNHNETQRLQRRLQGLRKSELSAGERYCLAMDAAGRELAKQIYDDTGDDSHPDFDESMRKADPRGGSYHRRVTNKETGKHRYFYNEDDYAKQDGAHVSGRDVLKKKCRAGLVKRIGKGCSLDDLKGYGGYDDELIKDAIRDSVRAGELSHAGGNLKPAAVKKLGAAGSKG